MWDSHCTQRGAGLCLAPGAVGAAGLGVHSVPTHCGSAWGRRESRQGSGAPSPVLAGRRARFGNARVWSETHSKLHLVREPPLSSATSGAGGLGCVGRGEQRAAVGTRPAGRVPPSSAGVPWLPGGPEPPTTTTWAPHLATFGPRAPGAPKGAAPLQDGPVEFKLQHA